MRRTVAHTTHLVAVPERVLDLVELDLAQRPVQVQHVLRRIATTRKRESKEASALELQELVTDRLLDERTLTLLSLLLSSSESISSSSLPKKMCTKP